MKTLRLLLLFLALSPLAHAADIAPSLILGTWLGDKYITFYEDGSYGLQKYEGAPIDKENRSYSIKGDKITWNALGEVFTETIVTLTKTKLVIRTAEGNLDTYRRIGATPAAELAPEKPATTPRLPSTEVYDSVEPPPADYPKTPDAVVKAFLTADAAGKRLDSDTSGELLALTDWQDSPGWDGIGVIKSFAIGKPVIKGDTATVPVTYQRVGALEAFTFAKDITPEENTFELIKVDSLWKITEPAGAAPHVAVASVLDFLKKFGGSDTPEGKAAIRALTALQ